MSLPPVLLVNGTDDHRRRAFLRNLVTKFQSEGYAIYPVDGEDAETLGNLIATTGVLFTNNALVIVSHPEKMDLSDTILEHLRNKDPFLTLVLVSESDKPTGDVVKQVPKQNIKSFSLPAFYKLDEHAAGYAQEHAKSQGILLPADLAMAMVKRAGNDLGVVTFEVDKAVKLAQYLGNTTLTPQHVKQTIAPLLELDGSVLMDAIGMRRLNKVADELHRYSQSKRADPTIEFCGRTMTPTVLRWLQASYLHEKGTAPSAAAGRVGSNPWYWEHKVLPQALSWGVLGCKKLLAVVSRSQVAVFEGALSPWGILETGILTAIRA